MTKYERAQAVAELRKLHQLSDDLCWPGIENYVSLTIDKEGRAYHMSRIGYPFHKKGNLNDESLQDVLKAVVFDGMLYDDEEGYVMYSWNRERVDFRNATLESLKDNHPIVYAVCFPNSEYWEVQGFDTLEEVKEYVKERLDF